MGGINYKRQVQRKLTAIFHYLRERKKMRKLLLLMRRNMAHIIIYI